MKRRLLLPATLFAFFALTGVGRFSTRAMADQSEIVLRLREMLKATGDQLCRPGGDFNAIVRQFPLRFDENELVASLQAFTGPKTSNSGRTGAAVAIRDQQYMERGVDLSIHFTDGALMALSTGFKRGFNVDLTWKRLGNGHVELVRLRSGVDSYALWDRFC